jgi:competence protein ComEC
MDHFKGITELAREMHIGSVFVYDGNVVRTGEVTDKVWDGEAGAPVSGIADESLRFVGGGDVVTLGKDANAEIMFPAKGSKEEYRRTVLENEDENATSLLVKVNIGSISILMTGDIGFDGEKSILSSLKNKALLETDILKVGHHGSKTSTSDEFLSAVSPKISVIQVGVNNYGHPTPEVLDKLSEAGIITYRNDLAGAIMMKEKSADKITVLTEKTAFISKALMGKYCMGNQQKRRRKLVI